MAETVSFHPYLPLLNPRGPRNPRASMEMDRCHPPLCLVHWFVRARERYRFPL